MFVAACNLELRISLFHIPFHVATMVSQQFFMYRYFTAIPTSWYVTCYIKCMRHKRKIQNIIRMLIKSRFYFELSLQERHRFIKDILRKFPTSLWRPESFGEKNLFLGSDE